MQARRRRFGAVEVWAPIPAGLTVETLDCTLTGPGGLSLDQVLDVGGDPTVHFVLDEVPAGAGDTIALSTRTGDAGTLCTASSSIDVTAGMTAEKTLILQCEGADR